MDYPQILAPVRHFLHCPTPQAWIDEARKPENLPLLLTDHMVCELKAAQNALLLVRKYVADKEGADELLACLKPYEDFTYRGGPSRISSRCINGLIKAPCRKPTIPGAVSWWTAWYC
jgi:tRNA-(ms[2]io[6]A)-hydroxylase